MDLSDAGLHKYTFRLHGRPLACVRFSAQQAALDFLQETYDHHHGLGVFEGAPLVGKTTIIREFCEKLSAATAIAFIDCRNLDDGGLFATVLKQFGYELEDSSLNEQLNLLKVFLVQQTSVKHAPLLFVENANAMCAVVYHAFRQLIDARYFGQSAIRVVLIGSQSCDLAANELTTDSIEAHKTGEFVLGPMTAAETENYVHSKIRAGGCDQPETIVPESVCKDIFEESDGIPGLVDRCMLLRILEADKLPLVSKHDPDSNCKAQESAPEDMVPPIEMIQESTDFPQLYVTLNGETLQTVSLQTPRLLIGRSQVNDITINSELVSRHHAMLIRENGATLLTDLNSTNGLFVNSRRVVSHVLRHNDIISIGNYNIKICDENTRQSAELDAMALDDTATMKVLAEMRILKAKKLACSLQRAAN